MKKLPRIFRLASVMAATVTVAGLAACTSSAPHAVQVSELGVQVSVPAGALDAGATLRVTRAVQPASAQPVDIQIGQPVQISPSSGQLHGQATIKFNYPAQLPHGVKPADLMVAAFNPLVKAWLPVDSVLNPTLRTLTVVTSHFSDWEVTATNPELVQSEDDFAAGFTPSPDDPFGGWLERLLPPPPHVACEPFSYRLTVTTTDYGSPGLQEACPMRTTDPNVVIVKLANVNAYPVLVKLPPGVDVMPGQPVGEAFEEVMSELLAQYAHRDSVLLRGGDTIELEVHTDHLQSNAQITMDVDSGMLLEDMAMWTIGMGADQKGAAWDALRKLKDTKEGLDDISVCLQNTADQWYNNPKYLKELQSDKSASKLIGGAIEKCAGNISKGVDGFWNKAWQKAEGAANFAKDTFELPGKKLVGIIDKFTTVWDNPHVITEWTEGLIAALTPDHASRVTIKLTLTDFSGHLSDALPQPSEYGFQTTDNHDTRGMGLVEPEDYLPPSGSPGTCNTQGDSTWLGTEPPQIAAGTYRFSAQDGSVYAPQVTMAVVPIAPGMTNAAATFVNSLKATCQFTMSRSGPLTATLWKSPSFGSVTRVYQVINGGSGESEFMLFAVSGGYYVYVLATPGVPPPGSGGLGADVVTNVAQALQKLDETLGTHFLPANGYTPGTATWSAGTVPAVSGVAAYVGTWAGHGRYIGINSSGRGTYDWRTYVICGSSDAKPGYPCEPANNAVSDGGHVTFQLVTSGSQAVAHILTSNDPGIQGDIPIVVLKRNAQGQPAVITLDQTKFCNPTTGADLDLPSYCGA